ncbi:GerAB/ArcD/ProY family transporter [Pontibacillus sp. HMF3514]|uniref:GerAB/ArcD/ProY family transporter n=1 Tax=Pontibacillus sp. HMF3514 TaxID=2692425 RepID=UPI0013205645|nr:GerAB/ArcD/ProY family transporter [Pontibacillus sp. HMF3514]QHE51205.1 GerAB/ArcD/ProY family transporter [Pontibacillus sp. HMF3514]
MKINLDIPAGVKIEAFYMFFLIHTMQIGAGLMGVSTHIYTFAKHDAWISIIIAGIWLHITVFVMITILRQYQNADLFGIQRDLFGKWINIILGTAFSIYVFAVLLSVLLNYVEVVQVFIFPTMPTWLISLFLISLGVYAVLGGIRIVAGSAFLFFFATIWLTGFLYKPISLMEMNHFSPIMDASYKEILYGAYKTSFSFIGLEILLFAYPYIKNKNKVHLSAQLGTLLTVTLTFLVVFVSIGYFSGDQLERLIWATLSFFKIIRFPFMERFDLIAVAFWMMVILPNIIIFTWLLSFCVKRLYNIRQRTSVYIVSGTLFLVSIFFQYRLNINTLTDWTGKVGFYIAFVYPFVLLPIVLIKKRIQKKARR